MAWYQPPKGIGVVVDHGWSAMRSHGSHFLTNFCLLAQALDPDVVPIICLCDLNALQMYLSLYCAVSAPSEGFRKQLKGFGHKDAPSKAHVLIDVQCIVLNTYPTLRAAFGGLSKA